MSGTPRATEHPLGTATKKFSLSSLVNTFQTKLDFMQRGMNTYNTFFGFYALSNTPLGLDSEENKS